MIQFFAPDIDSDLRLPEGESQHCVKVLRHVAGDLIEVIDGRGHRYECRLVDPHPRHAAVEIVECYDVPLCWSSEITLAVAPTKAIDRMEWMVEKLTEIGVNRIVPLRCRFSERKEIKRERLERVAVAAMKQSLKTVLPEITEMIPLEQAIARFAPEQRFIAYCNKSIPRKLLSQEYRPGLDTMIMIGPEGDFSIDEIEASLEAGFIPVSLGDNRLRTETAAITAVDTCHILDQRLAPRP